VAVGGGWEYVAETRGERRGGIGVREGESRWKEDEGGEREASS